MRLASGFVLAFDLWLSPFLRPLVDLVFRHWACLSQPFPWYFSGRFVPEA